MNAPNHLFAVTIGEAEIRVPKEAAVIAYLEQQIENRAPIEFTFAAPRGEAVETPAIGAEFNGGVYAGVTVHDNRPHHLVLLPGEAQDLNWSDAVRWAESQGGYLPSRFDQLVLFRNLKSEFAEEIYWSGEEYAGLAEFAWGQGFGGGDQDYWHKGSKYRARAVRRVAI
jgi:hypothetical protein